MLRLYWHKFIVPFWPMVITALACFIIASLAGLGAPLIIKLLIDDALTAGSVASLHFISIGIVALYLVRGLFYYLYGYTMAKAGNNMIYRIREEMFARLQGLDYSYFLNTPAGHILSLFTNDLWLIQQAVSQSIPDMMVETLNLLIIMGIMIYFDWQLACVTFATLPFIFFAIEMFNVKIGRLGHLVEEALAKVTSILHQSLLSIMVVQSYVREDYEYRKFSAKINEASADLIKAQRLNAMLVPLVEFMAAIGLTVIIWYGGREVISGNLSIGGMFAFLVYIINVPTPVRKISEASSKLKMGMVAWRRIVRLAQQPQNIPDGSRILEHAAGIVEFKGVSFSYHRDNGILSNITLDARPGEVVAIVGPSGAGKSSFANLLLRFYDPTEGAIYLDGVDLREWKIQCLRRQIGFIQQEPVLFNTSVLENIKYGRPDATMEEIIEAAQLADAHNFIMELSQGYQTQVGSMGGSLSGGQRQRIAIARAIILKPAILLLDEPTASLDTQAEKQVMRAIRNVSLGRTTFIITHRLSTLLSTDKVVYLDSGQIAEMGTPDELLERGGLYARAVQMGEAKS